jgi:two-component system, cell cycle response regulator DivK
MFTAENDNPHRAETVKTILIVEDNVLNMRLFDQVLIANGYRTILSTDGSDVLEIADKRRPDLIVMDIQLPTRSGLDLTRELKANENLKHIPIIGVTAFAMKGDERKILETGCDDYMAKPISVPAFLEMVAKQLS